jgi:hypothetical protein
MIHLFSLVENNSIAKKEIFFKTIDGALSIDHSKFGTKV